ncbi:MAG TPA: hypothetical protein VIT83_05280, partial [Gammaproteobacteria bacterium]
MSSLRARSIFNAVLLLLAGGLIAFIWFGPASTPPKAPKLSPIDTRAVTRVRIERPGRLPIALR